MPDGLWVLFMIVVLLGGMTTAVLKGRRITKKALELSIIGRVGEKTMTFEFLTYVSKGTKVKIEILDKEYRVTGFNPTDRVMHVEEIR